jgi:ubiquinone/menaquinone biosynthesis C-methylase UbiE
MTKRPTSISHESYDRSYFLDYMDGADVFARTGGRDLAPRLAIALELTSVKPGQRILDVGCGRGEVAGQCSRRGACVHGLDFSRAALEIASHLRIAAAEAKECLYLERASVLNLPFASQEFDRVFMLDIVEHLYPDELLAAFREVRRVMRPNGRLVIHTMPNADYYRWGYPIYRWLIRLMGKRLPRDPRERWYRGETHVNVQSPRALRRTLQKAGFISPRVWLQPISNHSQFSWLIGLPIVNRILCNDILALVEKV